LAEKAGTFGSRIVDSVAPTLVLAAGRIADTRGLAAALCIGADGVVMGKRFLATPEANAHREYKAKLLAANEEERYARCFSEADGRMHLIPNTENFVHEALGQ